MVKIKEYEYCQGFNYLRKAKKMTALVDKNSKIKITYEN